MTTNADIMPDDSERRHDPLCPHTWGLPMPASEPSECGYCGIIAMVRADERETNVQLITSLCAHTKYLGCKPCIHDELVNMITEGVSNG